MAKGYWVTSYRSISDPDKLAAYAALAGPAIAPFGGRYLARGLVGPPNADEARVWFERALAQGVAEVRADLAGLPAPKVPAHAPQAVGR